MDLTIEQKEDLKKRLAEAEQWDQAFSRLLSQYMFSPKTSHLTGNDILQVTTLAVNAFQGCRPIIEDWEMDITND
jgi:hypothetical protein